MTLDTAVARVRAIERDLVTGTLTVPYPAAVHADLMACVRVFTTYSTTPAKAKEIGMRLDAVELPW